MDRFQQFPCTEASPIRTSFIRPYTAGTSARAPRNCHAEFEMRDQSAHAPQAERAGTAGPTGPWRPWRSQKAIHHHHQRFQQGSSRGGNSLRCRTRGMNERRATCRVDGGTRGHGDSTLLRHPRARGRGCRGRSPDITAHQDVPTAHAWMRRQSEVRTRTAPPLWLSRDSRAFA